MLSYITHSVEETEEIAKLFAKKLRAGDVVAFTGGLGVGKTAFTRGLAAGLSLDCDVLSPTFTLMNEYRGELPLYHFDMYRVATYDDLYSTGFFDYLGSKAILAVEWSENIETALPENALHVALENLGDDTRRITIEGDERF